jgi:DNA-binding transcriptional ArsR family regulator
MHGHAMDKPLTRQHHLLAAIGHVSRFRLFMLLAERERCVTELAAEVGLSQSCTTRHLQALTAAGVVVGKREGKRVRVRLRLERPEVAGLLAWARLGALDLASLPEAAPAAPSRAAHPPRKGVATAAALSGQSGGGAPEPLAPQSAPRMEPISGTSDPPEPVRPSRAVRQDLEDFLL